jgi:hypothetical protein
MPYEQILRRAFEIVRNNLYLIGLGILVSLGSGGGNSGNSGTSYTVNDQDVAEFTGDLPLQLPDFPLEQFQSDGGWILPTAVIIFLILIGLIIGLIVFVVSSVARGGLVSSVNRIEEGGTSSFGDGWRSGWARLWTLLGINFLPAIPVIIGVLILLATVGTTVGFASLFDVSNWAEAIIGTGIALSIGLLCILLPITLALSLLRTFALRACMLEGAGVWHSYSRGWNVATANLGPAIIFFLIQIAISIVLGLLLFLPGILVALCCLLWPLFLIVRGAVDAYFSTVWTLVWRQWTGLGTNQAVESI